MDIRGIHEAFLMALHIASKPYQLSLHGIHPMYPFCSDHKNWVNEINPRATGLSHSFTDIRGIGKTESFVEN